MNKLTAIIKNNRLYTVLFLFILGINVMLVIGWVTERNEEKAQILSVDEQTPAPEAAPEVKTMFDEEEVEARQEKIMALMKENPLLGIFFGLINFAIFFVILIGLGLDVRFLKCLFAKKVFITRTVEKPSPNWTIGDVARVTLIFLSLGYIFAMAQSFLANIFPILHNDNFRMIFNTALMNIVGISVIMYFVVKKHGQNILALGLTVKEGISNIFSAIVGYVALAPVFVGIMVVTFFVVKMIGYKPPVQPIVQIFMEEKQTSILWFSTLFAAIAGPVAEEIFFRGFMYTAIREKLGIGRAMVITSVVFSLLHAHIVGFLPILALGLLLAYLYEKTGSLVSSISVHIIHNVGMVLLVFIARSIGT